MLHKHFAAGAATDSLFMHIAWNIHTSLYMPVLFHINALRLLSPCFSTRCTLKQMYVIIPPLNNETKVLLVSKWQHLLKRLLTFISIWMFLCEVWVSALFCRLHSPRPTRGCLPSWYSPLISFSPLSDASLAHSVLTCLGRNAPTF